MCLYVFWKQMKQRMMGGLANAFHHSGAKIAASQIGDFSANFPRTPLTFTVNTLPGACTASGGRENYGEY